MPVSERTLQRLNGVLETYGRLSRITQKSELRIPKNVSRAGKNSGALKNTVVIAPLFRW